VRTIAVAIAVGGSATASLSASVVLPGLTNNLVCYYDFEHPVATNAAQEADLGLSGTDLDLVNGAAAMRTGDGAYPGSHGSLQTQQVNPASAGNDDWKAGVYRAGGVASLNGFNAASGITLMGWVKPIGPNPSHNSETPAPEDFYNAVGLFGVLSGDSDGHNVRALLEVIDVGGTLRLVALGRRIDGGSSLTLAATSSWETLLPANTWTHLTATFNFDAGTMALYHNGLPLAANYTTPSDVWGVIGGAEPDLTSPSNPAGIKIGGSFPQNTRERNAFNGRFDDLMFFNRVLDPAEVQDQYANFSGQSNEPPKLKPSIEGTQIRLTWPESAAEYKLETASDLVTGDWRPVNENAITNNGELSVTLPITNPRQEFFWLKKP
jgi:hypothetical protein